MASCIESTCFMQLLYFVLGLFAGSGVAGTADDRITPCRPASRVAPSQPRPPPQHHHLIYPFLSALIVLPQQSAVRTDSGTTDWFSVSKGVRHGCSMSPQLFSVYTESIMREVEEEQSNSEYDELSVGGTKITEIEKCR